ncbi:glycosyltransferase family 2 protein [Croceibacter atlanticus]|uniref:glycosyltransferase family 2 protein n=1 Tax=Croceibacter atlanticus TaxID=313588 RepID=UPI0030DD9554|tara:strand:- start:96830 stop:97759 length:930 start_codon:yes stop_codon:yes gene_type:complete
MPLFSIVSPVYRAEKCLKELVARIEDAMLSITPDYEIILVEDCGPDNSWSVIKEISVNNKKVKGVKLSRNFGQHYAITAGLDYSKGTWVVVMDCDLQDKPEEIPRLYKKALEGYDVVLARRSDRKDKYFKKLFSRVFYKALSYLTGAPMDATVANYGIYSRNVVKAVCSMRESIRYFPTMVKWVGFKSAKIDVEHAQRTHGESSYDFFKLVDLATDIILAYSDKPMRLMIKGGFIISIISFIIAVIYLIKYLCGDVLIIGYTSMIISIWLLSGIILLTLGVVGLYLGKTFEGVKRRPIYIASNTTFDDE